MTKRKHQDKLPESVIGKLQEYLAILNEIGPEVRVPTFLALWPEVQRWDPELGEYTEMSDEFGVASELRKEMNGLLEQYPRLSKFVFGDGPSLMTVEEYEKMPQDVFEDEYGVLHFTDYALEEIHDAQESRYYLEIADARLKLIEALQRSLFTFARSVTIDELKKRSANRGGDEPLFSASLRIDVQAVVSVGADGHLTAENNDFLDLVGKYSIPVSRIRLCLTCGQLFWATRSDSFGCKKQCSTNVRVQRFRRNNPEKYAEIQANYREQRRENYKYKKKLKLKSEKRVRRGV